MENAVENESYREPLKGGVSLVWEKLSYWSSEFYLLLPNLIAGTITLILFLLIAFSLRRLIIRAFKQEERIDLGKLLSAIAFWAIILLGVMLALTIAVPSIRPGDLISGLGLGSLAVGFAFKDILQNWFSGLLILLRLPFRRGDQIKIDEIEGTVQRIEPRATIIRTFDGKDIVVPNTKVYTSNVIIQTSQPKRRVELNLTVGYDNDINFIRKIILEALRPINEIHTTPEPQILSWELGATSLGMKIRWWINSEQSQEVISRARAIQAIKEIFQANDIDPTDPALVYSISHSPAAAARKKKKSSTSKSKDVKDVNKVTPPPTLKMKSEDPETYTPKIESKAYTLLPDDEL